MIPVATAIRTARAFAATAAVLAGLAGCTGGCGGTGEPAKGSPTDASSAAADVAQTADSPAVEQKAAAGGRDRVVVTPRAAVLCADTEFQPTAAADLDGDGELERVAARRDGEEYLVSIHSLPDLQIEQTWRIRADYLELGVTRSDDGIAGDLWLHPGVVVDDETNDWRFTVEHLEGDRFVELSSTTSSSRPNLRLDVDGDGRVDPITITDDGPVVILGRRQVATSLDATERSIRGVPAPFGRERAVDLDGDGDRDVVVEGIGELVIAELPSFRKVWSRASKGTLAGVVRWSAAPSGYVVQALTDATARSTQRLIAADGSHEDLAVWSHGGDNEYVRTAPFTDPAGDGSLLALSVPRFTALFAKPGAKIERLEVQLAASGDPALPQAGPVRLIRKASVGWEAFPGPLVLDFDGDGTSEILLEESSSYMTCDMSGGGSTSRWLLLDGTGAVLWQDEERYRSFGKDYDRDLTARAALIDLGGGARGLRMRTDAEEFWVFPEGRAPAQVPACLE